MANIGNRINLKSPLSRKEHECDMCHAKISKGEHYIRATAQKEGKFPFTGKYCIGEPWKDVIADMRRRRDLSTEESPTG